MEKILNIYQRINAVMKEVTYVRKESKKVNNMYTFVSHDAVTGSLQGPMANNGIVMVPTIAELTQDGNRTIVKMEISFINADEPSDRFVVYHYGYGIDAQDKGIGKAVSYAVKYALLKLFCLETGDDVESSLQDYVSKEQMENNELMQVALKEKKAALLDLAGKENVPELTTYIKELKDTFKSQTEPQLFFSKSTEIFIEDFLNWKEKRNQVA